MSILTFYYRLISGTQNRRIMWLINIGIIIVAVYLVFWILYLVFMCQPTRSSWLSLDLRYTDYTCLERRISDIMSGVTSVSTDIYALLLPELVVKSIQVSWTRKLVLYSVLGCNVLTIGAGIGRTVAMAHLTDGQRDITCKPASPLFPLV
jgi:hypothetical protein